MSGENRSKDLDLRGIRLCGENRRNIFQQTENTGKEHLMRQKTFGKWLAAAGILMAMTIWMVLPALGCADGEFYKDHL